MRGAPARAIQELAGHADLTMTQRYMHLSPAALDSAIRLLEQPTGSARSAREPAIGPKDFGNMVETGLRS
jgi:site-specific recombinase XerC